MGAERTATFAEHVQELRGRLMWTLLFVAIGAGVGYALHGHLLEIMQRPLNDTLYYTNPTGAFSFIIKICTVFGIIVALPMALYQVFAFFEPLIAVKTRRMLTLYVFVSVLLAGSGILFAYYISLPAALHFLVNFGGEGIESLITANEYFNFVLAYIAGFAVLFQLPLIILFINKVTPLTPRKLLGGTRYMVLGSFVVAAVITPTPDPFNQALMAGPIILLYFLSVLVVAVINHQSRAQRQQARQQAELSAPDEWLDVLSKEAELASAPISVPVALIKPAVPKAAPAPVGRKPRLVNDMIVPGRSVAVPAYHPRSRAAPVPKQPITAPRPTRLITDFVPASE